MSRVVYGEEQDVPVTTEPGDEEGTGERLEGHLHHLSGTHPGGGDTQYHQQTTQHLQSCVGTCMIGLALSAGLTARCLGMRLWTILSWWETAGDKTVTENAFQHPLTPLPVQRPNKNLCLKLHGSCVSQSTTLEQTDCMNNGWMNCPVNFGLQPNTSAAVLCVSLIANGRMPRFWTLTFSTL